MILLVVFFHTSNPHSPNIAIVFLCYRLQYNLMYPGQPKPSLFLWVCLSSSPKMMLILEKYNWKQNILPTHKTFPQRYNIQKVVSSFNRINIKPECAAHHGQSSKRLQRHNSVLFYTHADTPHYLHVLQINND